MNQCSKHGGTLVKFDGSACPMCSNEDYPIMTTEAAKRAAELIAVEEAKGDYVPYETAFTNFIQHVSDVAETYCAEMTDANYERLRALILPKPPADPIADLLSAIGDEQIKDPSRKWFDILPEVMAKRGGRIVFGEQS